MDGLVEAISWASSTLWVSSRLWTAEKIMRCLKIGLKNAPTDVAAGFGVIHGGSTKLVVAVRLCAPPNILWDCRQSVLRSGCFCAKPLAVRSCFFSDGGDGPIGTRYKLSKNYMNKKIYLINIYIKTICIFNIV